MLGLGYIVRFVGLDFSKEGSFFLIIMGLYFIIAIIFKKAATWVLLVIDLFVGVGMQYLRMINVPWYNRLYDSRIGQLLIGGPFETRLLIYILPEVVKNLGDLIRYIPQGYRDLLNL